MTVLTLTNLKGGVGKTTLAGLLAKYIARYNTLDPVLVIDMDHQCGITTFLMGKRPGNDQATIYDVLKAEAAGSDSAALFVQSVMKIDGEDRLHLVPSSPLLNQFDAKEVDPCLLSYVLEKVAAYLAPNAVILIDTGNIPQLVQMGVMAADAVIVPMTISRQSFIPTSSTIGMVLRENKRLLGLVPSMVGNATWERESLRVYAENMSKTKLLAQSGARVYPGLPYSKAMVRGECILRTSTAKVAIPEKFIPVLDAIFTDLFGRSAQPQIVEAMAETLPVPASIEQAA